MMIFLYIATGVLTAFVIWSYIYFWHKDNEHFNRIINNINCPAGSKHQSSYCDDARDAADTLEPPPETL